MKVVYKTLPKRHKTNSTGIYYKEIEKTTIDDKGNLKTSKSDKVYSIQYKDIDGVWKFKTIGKYSDGVRENYCKSKRTEIINHTNLGEQPEILKKHKKKNIISFDSIAIKYFDSVEGINSDIETSKTRYRLHIEPFIANRHIEDITYKDIEIIQKAKQKTHAPKTVNHITTLVGTIFNYAIEKEDFDFINPNKKIKKLKVDNQRERYLTLEEVDILLEKVSSTETLFLFVNLALSIGARLNTIMNIQKKNIDLENKTINLYDYKNKTSYKGFITDRLYVLLKEQLPKLKVNDIVINEYAADTIQHKLKEVFDELFNEGLAKNDSKNRVVTHTLRHTFASQLAIQGTPIFTIQKLMNHKDINMTLRYAKLAPDNGKIEVIGLYH